MTGDATVKPNTRTAKRLNSKAQADLEVKINQLQTRRTYYTNQVKNIQSQLSAETPENALTKSEIQVMIKRLDSASEHIDQVHIDLMCEAGEEMPISEADEKALNEEILKLKGTLLDRLGLKNPSTVDIAQGTSSTVDIAHGTSSKLRIEVQQTDSAGNIPNTWGTFDGDRTKWKSFRDRWNAAMHENKNVKAVVKIRQLQSACVKQAEGVIGEFDITEEDYPKAWKKLNRIYDDNYMQVQSFMQLLFNLPQMNGSLSSSMRTTIDTVQKALSGLKPFTPCAATVSTFAVFMVIERMDSSTFRAWEKYRPTLCKPVANAAEQNNEAEPGLDNIGRHIPTWPELSQFLEGEAIIRVHDEKRALASAGQRNLTTNQQSKRPIKNNSKGKGDYPEFLQCVLCVAIHPIFHCDVFIGLNLCGRLNHVTQYNLCVRCLRKNHDGPCVRKRCNDPCPRCRTETKYHNRLLCPNMDAKAGPTLAALDKQSKKRKHQDRSRKPIKKRRFNQAESGHSNDLRSSINKIGDWALLTPRSNAIKPIKNIKDGKSEFTVLLATMNIKIQTFNQKTVNCRAIADTGATLNCITSQFVDANKLATVKCQRRILGVSGPETIKRKVKAIIRPWFDSEVSMKTEFFILNSLDGHYPHKQIESSKDEIIKLGLADVDFDIPAPINALLSADIYANIVGSDLYKHKDGAIMQSTLFGHIILGKFIVKNNPINDVSILSVMQSNENDNMTKALTKFWEIEEINKYENNSELNNEHKCVEDLFINTHYRDPNGRYVVTIPIRPNHKELGDSRAIALSQFIQLEKRLNKNNDLKRKYVDSMRENMHLGYIQPAHTPSASELCYWLPHHPVLRKFRIVLNASAKTSTGESLNSIQMVGGKLQYDLQLQMMRFRRHKIGISTDITKMFNRVGLNPKQWNLHRFFWRENPNELMKEYVMTVVIFGEASSPYNAVRALIQCARDLKTEFPHASKVIEQSFYMDDGIFGSESTAEAKLLCKEIEFVLGQGGFTLKGWDSNSKEVEFSMNALSNNDVIIGDDDETKILGIRWLKQTDEFTIFVRQISNQSNATKRSVLREIARLYDPNGFIAPIVIQAKMLMQKIWKLNNLNWDDLIPQEIKIEWIKIYENLPLLENFKIKRWLKTGSECNVQIHAFCDASKDAYGTAIFVRVIDSRGEIFCNLLSAKSRVAPLKGVTIPRMELLAAVMLSEQLESVMDACEFTQNKVTLWSDSTIVLSWLNKKPHELKAFVANRIEKIQKITEHSQWKHVRSGDNPADLVSRGMSMHDFLKSDLWLHGPSWLSQHESKWPTPKLSISLSAKEEISKECKPPSSTAKALCLTSHEDRTILYERFNELDKIINITAYVLRVFKIAKRKRDTISQIHRGKYLTSEERSDAIKFWIKFDQNKAFSKEIKCIEAGDKLPAKSTIASLKPILDKDGLLRVGGRISKACIPYQRKHQFIIPHKSRMSYLVIRHAHKATLHGGAQIMTQFIRKEFWVPKIRFDIKRYISSCVECVKQAQETSGQIMADLPEVRLKPAPPFQHVGVDMAGPYNMRVSDRQNLNTRARKLPDEKGWIVVYVCLVTRAVHLEATDGLSADDFLVAHTKFTSRRGNPEKIYSDNGTNFVGANKELQKAFETWKDGKIQKHVSLKGTKWHFITPSAPHEGGIWEAAVKSMKHHLKRVMGVQKYSYKGISCLISNIEACLNSRPLSTLSDDPNDLEALTPAHFLIGRPLNVPLSEKCDSPPYNIKRLYLQLQCQIQAFWKQWSNDYLQSLTQTPKWREEQENLKIDQLVIIKTDNIPPTYWAMARIIKTHIGTDNKVRSVTLKTQSGELKRSVRKICVLPTDIELSYWR